MTADKQIFFDGKKVTLTRLENMLLGSAPDQKKTVIIRADKNLPYGDVIKLMGILQGAGVLDISIAVK